MQDPITVGVVGLGYWGRNLARNLASMPACELAWCCDSDAARLADLPAEVPEGVRRATRFEDMLVAEGLDAVVLATPVAEHARMAREALEAGKHCFVEKPLAQTTGQAAALSCLAADRDLVLMVGHLLEFHPAVATLGRLIRQGELGEVHYIHSQRLNLGQLRSDENALWSLGAHDVSVSLALTGEVPVEVSARGAGFVRVGVDDVVFAFLRFDSGVIAHHHLSWLDPHKERRLTVVGSRRMASFDDVAAERKLTIFDKGFDADGDTEGAYVPRSGDRWSPAIDEAEPLRLELDHFVECVHTGARPRSDGASGTRVVAVLEALQHSLDEGGSIQRVEQRGALA